MTLKEIEDELKKEFKEFNPQNFDGFFKAAMNHKRFCWLWNKLTEERFQRFNGYESYYAYNSDIESYSLCLCGHTYERHFDRYNDNYPAGCKYCRHGDEYENEEICAGFKAAN